MAARAIRGGGTSRTAPSAAAAINRRVTLSRDRIFTRKRNTLIIAATAGTLTVATAASAAAAVWPSGSPASPAGTAFGAIAAAAGPSGQAVPEQHAMQKHLAVRHVGFATERQAAGVLVHRQAHQVALAQAAKRKAQAALAAKRQAAARSSRQQTAAQPSPGRQPAVSSAPARSGSAQSVAKGMLASFGWSTSQFSCLEPLWARESGWHVAASNPSTGAYGIPQALPGSKMASAGADWRTNAATQVRWGLTYIKGTYGSPCAAWRHAQAEGWY
jgi:hypothetical protein